MITHLQNLLSEMLHSRYVEMFSKFPEANLKFIEEVQEVLKKNYRIVWFLKIYRDFIREGREEVGRLRLRQSLKEIKHFLDLAETNRIQKILNYPLEGKNVGEVLRGISNLEDEWRASLVSREIPHSKEKSEIFLSLNDRWKWVLKKTKQCELESKAMGHCGTVNDDEWILSLREVKDGGSIPHITASWNPKTGLLTQIKGRHNEMPHAKYHDMILDLMADPRIRGVSAEDQDPDTDFHVFDYAGKRDIRAVLGDKYYDMLSDDQRVELG